MWCVRPVVLNHSLKGEYNVDDSENNLYHGVVLVGAHTDILRSTVQGDSKPESSLLRRYEG